MDRRKGTKGLAGTTRDPALPAPPRTRRGPAPTPTPRPRPPPVTRSPEPEPESGATPAHRDLEPQRLERRWERSCPMWRTRRRTPLALGSQKSWGSDLHRVTAPSRTPWVAKDPSLACPPAPRALLRRCSERRQQGEAQRSSHGGRGSVYEPPAVGGDPAEALQNLTGPQSGSVTNRLWGRGSVTSLC